MSYLFLAFVIGQVPMTEYVPISDLSDFSLNSLSEESFESLLDASNGISEAVILLDVSEVLISLPETLNAFEPTEVKLFIPESYLNQSNLNNGSKAFFAANLTKESKFASTYDFGDFPNLTTSYARSEINNIKGVELSIGGIRFGNNQIAKPNLRIYTSGAHGAYIVLLDFSWNATIIQNSSRQALLKYRYEVYYRNILNFLNMLKEDIIFLIATLLFPFLVLFYFSRSNRQASQNFKKQEIKIEQLKAASEAQESLDVYIQKRIEVVSEKTRLELLKVEKRSNGVYRLAVFFTSFSVLAPIGAIVVYISVDPMNQYIFQDRLIENLSYLGGVMTITPELNLNPQRDWRILLVGISFGFLFLAAARELLRIQMQLNSRLNYLTSEISYFENVIEAFRISIKAKEANNYDLDSKKVLEKIIQRLSFYAIEPSIPSLKENVKESDSILQSQLNLLKNLTEQVKALSNKESSS